MAEHEIILNKDDFPSNSNASKEEKPKMEKIVKGEVKKTKPNAIKKFFDAFFSEAANEDDLKSTIIFGYIIPTVKDTIVETGKMLLEGIFYGSTSPNRRPSSSTAAKPVKVSYSDYYNKNKPVRTSEVDSYHFDDIVFNSRGDAEQVLDALIDNTRDYDAASVGDLCDLVGIDTKFTDYQHGWTDLRRTTISRVRDGYIINFPAPKSIKNN